MKTNEITIVLVRNHIKYEVYNQVGSQVGYQACDQVIEEIEYVVGNNLLAWNVIHATQSKLGL